MNRPLKTLIPIVCLLLTMSTWSAAAWAETYSEGVVSGEVATEEPELPYALKGETSIEQLTIAYHESLREVAAATQRVEELQVQVDAVEAQLPAVQARSDASLRQRYKMQESPKSIVDILLSSNSIDDFLQELDYINYISEASLDDFNELRELKRSLDEAKAEQERLLAETQARMDAAASALEAEQAERAAKQSRYVAASQAQARAEGGAASVGRAPEGVEQPEGYSEAATTDIGAINDGADWYADRDEFIAEWAPRIDAYLAGSALDGQGVNFAASAWKYCIDPRWSPAISTIESGKGAACIRPHNAWGWGAADSNPYGLASEWGSWEEAIDAHARGLAKGYGYTISMGGARAYCPITWQSWYNKTLGEMARI